MRFDVLLTSGAENDVDSIYGYIVENHGLKRADYVVAALEKTWERLATSPTRGNYPKELVALGVHDYREVHFKPYRIIYRVAGQKVFVYCVHDGRRDMQTLLQRRLLG